MKRKLLFLLLAVTCAIEVSAQASKYEPYPYTFVGVQGGGQVTFTNCDFQHLLTPIGAVSVGSFFSPEIGFRLDVQGFQNKAGSKISDEYHTYDFKYASTNLNLLLNLSNIFFPDDEHFLNVMLLGGWGIDYAWSKEGRNNLFNDLGKVDDNCLTYNLRVGLQLEMNVSKHFGINLELAANNKDDHFNLKRNYADDWQATAMVGVTYKFGFKKKRQSNPGSALASLDYDNTRSASSAVASTPVVEGEKKAKEEPAPVAPIIKKETVKVKENTRSDIFFAINSSSVKANEKGKIEKLAEWMKQHSTAKITLTAYADKGTGTPQINRAISQKRMTSVKNMLVEEYGIDANRITSNYKGDTEQPFADNDSNRVAIVIAEEQ